MRTRLTCFMVATSPAFHLSMVGFSLYAFLQFGCNNTLIRGVRCQLTGGAVARRASVRGAWIPDVLGYKTRFSDWESISWSSLICRGSVKTLLNDTMLDAAPKLSSAPLVCSVRLFLLIQPCFGTVRVWEHRTTPADTTVSWWQDEHHYESEPAWNCDRVDASFNYSGGTSRD
jgi:hypothetical protein